MTIEKETIIGKVEIVGETKSIHVATDTILKEDGVELATTRHRKVLHPLEYIVDGSWNITYSDTNISNEHQEVKDVANTVWTDEIKEKYKTKVSEQIAQHKKDNT